MSEKIIKIKSETDKLLEECIKTFREHHPEFEQMKISRNKIIYEIAKYYKD
jgi:hypothetical protein